MSVSNGIKQSSSFRNFLRSMQNLQRSLATPVTEPRDLSGILKDFEMAYELSWKVLKKVLNEQGHQSLGAKDVYSKAYQLNLIDNEDSWLAMIQDRNVTAHVYDDKQAQHIVERVRATYFPLLERLVAQLS